ncbi:protein LTO1 homolog [Coffea eugenioides]|uniref:protein LTO1 homolog n=1 Tax=Coffea eugenioides TaxID=49369 RepID=UPI000F6120CA|nr:protein LTO1 homolog [Coffea eugenioides]
MILGKTSGGVGSSLVFPINPRKSALSSILPTTMAASVEPNSMEDIFDSSLNLEETHVKEGYKEGYADGLVSGKEDGRQVGLKTGFEVGQELGFYKGCIDVWNSAIQVDSNCFSSRVVRSIKQMEELLSKYPISDPDDESVGDVMDSLRLKFRAICATLNVKLEYNGYPKSSDGENIQF